MKLSTAHKIGRFFQYFVLILVGVIMIYPLVWMVGATFKSNAEIFSGIGFLTANPTLQGYIDAVTQNYGGDISIWRAFINTYSFVIPKVIFTVISSVIAAYGFSRFQFRGKNLLFSILTCPQNIAIADQYVLSMAGALALKAALDRYTDHITLKWPNDIYWRDRKISGTLIETTVKGKRIDRCVYGIGLNVNQREFRSNAPNPMSLYNIIGRETPLEEMLDAVLRSFELYYRRAVEGDRDGICAEYNAALFRREGMHAYEDCATHERFEARISRVAPNGRLHLIDADGHERTYWMKEVRFIV